MTVCCHCELGKFYEHLEESQSVDERQWKTAQRENKGPQKLFENLSYVMSSNNNICVNFGTEFLYNISGQNAKPDNTIDAFVFEIQMIHVAEDLIIEVF